MNTAAETSAVSQERPKRSPTPIEETWLARRLGAPHLFLGVTTSGIRRDRVRSRILDLECAEEVAGRASGNPETFRGLFARLYGEPL